MALCIGDLVVVGFSRPPCYIVGTIEPPKKNQRNVYRYACALKLAVEGFETMREADVIHYDLAFLGVTASLPLELSRQISS